MVLDHHKSKGERPKTGNFEATERVAPWIVTEQLTLVDFPGSDGLKFANEWREYASVADVAVLLMDFSVSTVENGAPLEPLEYVSSDACLPGKLLLKNSTNCLLKIYLRIDWVHVAVVDGLLIRVTKGYPDTLS